MVKLGRKVVCLFKKTAQPGFGATWQRGETLSYKSGDNIFPAKI